jgi:hypothetical protein
MDGSVDEYQITLCRLNTKGGKVTAPGEGWRLESMCASIAPGVVWLAWRRPAQVRLKGCPKCHAAAKNEAGTACLGCGTEWG